jgi:hypothetical protein
VKSPRDTAASELFYAYAVVPAATTLPDLPAGLFDLPVEIVTAGGFTLIGQPSTADLADRFELAQDEAGRAWLTSCVVRHEQIVEACLSAGPVFPFGFGIMFESRSTLAENLMPHARALESYFEGTRNRREWAVKVYAGIDLPSRRTIAAEAVNGRDYLKKRHRSPLERSNAFEGARREAQQLIDGLSSEAVDVVGREAGSAPLASSTAAMVANVAFLVDREQTVSFRDAVAAFDSEDWEHLADITVSGPWPPYSFRPAIEFGSR